VASGVLIDEHAVIAFTGVLMLWTDASRVYQVLQQLSREEDLKMLSVSLQVVNLVMADQLMCDCGSWGYYLLWGIW
jgi:hypothetical protein